MPLDPPHQARATRKTTCGICLDDDINTNDMFYVDKCSHRFCCECLKRHIEVRLLEGSVTRCPHYGCQLNLTLRSCARLLTPKLREIWKQRIKENSIPVKNRIYCPNPRCSALMSVNELSKSTKEVRRYCLKCGQLICINCKGPWHNNLSCDDYRRLSPSDDIKLKALASRKFWRQCGNCQNMIELSRGCIKVTCRCGHRFCYQCGAKAEGCHHGRWHDYPPMPQLSPSQTPHEWLIILCAVCVLVLVVSCTRTSIQRKNPSQVRHGYWNTTGTPSNLF